MSTATTRKGNTVCCVAGCSNTYRNTTNVVLYSFPGRWYEEARRKTWISRVNRQNPDGSLWQPTKTSRICSEHFTGGQKSNNPSSPSFIPSIFPISRGKKHTSASCKKQALLNSVRITNIKTEKEIKQESEEEELKPLAYVTVPAFDTEGDEEEEEDDKNNVALQLKKYTEGNYSVPDLQDLSMTFESVIKKEEVDEFD